jgi:hypothetical protein
MKKSLLIFAIFMLLAGFSSKVFAQSFSAVAPMEGITYTYTVDGLTQGDTYSMGINTTYGTLSHQDNTAAYTATAVTDATVPASGIVTFDVLWESGASGTTYYLWIEIEDALGCSTFRALAINPQDAVAYDVNFSVVALEINDGSTVPTGLAGAETVNEDCPPTVDADQLAEDIGEAMHDGYFYAYFRVIREANPNTVNSSWGFAPAAATVDGVAAGTWAVSVDGGASFSAFAGSQTIPTGVNEIYVRVQVDNAATASDRSIVLNIGNTTADSGGLEVDQNTTGVNIATITVDPLPTVGTFGVQ